MYTRHLLRLSRGLLAASLLFLTALIGCSDPGTSVETEKVKDDEAMGNHMDLTTIADPAEKSAAEALKGAGAMVMLDEESHVSQVAFQNGGANDALLANLGKTPKLTSLMLMNCPQVTDKSVATMSGLKNLTQVQLMQTGISNAGAKKIQAALGKGAMVNHPGTARSMMQQNPSTAPGGGPGGGGPLGGGGPPGGGGRPGGR